MMSTQRTQYRSNLERNFNFRRKLDYEATRLQYTVSHHYTPDFLLAPNRFVETKGLFKGADRSRHLVIKKQHPDVRILFVFQDPKRKLSKVSKTTYADWCDKNGFAWLSEKQASVLSNEQLLELLNNT